MPVKIRLMRIGTNKRPFYRVVAVDERKKRTGAYLELLGTYNPLTEPHEIILNKERIEHWTKNGAVLSDGFLRMTKQAPQKPPRKPKKVKEEKPAVQPVVKPVEEVTAEPITVETEEQKVEETENPVTEQTETVKASEPKSEEPVKKS